MVYPPRTRTLVLPENRSSAPVVIPVPEWPPLLRDLPVARPPARKPRVRLAEHCVNARAWPIPAPRHHTRHGVLPGKKQRSTESGHRARQQRLFRRMKSQSRRSALLLLRRELLMHRLAMAGAVTIKNNALQVVLGAFQLNIMN